MDNFISWIFILIWFIFFISQIIGKAKKKEIPQQSNQHNEDDFSLDSIFGIPKENPTNESKSPKDIAHDLFDHFGVENKYSEHEIIETINYDKISRNQEKALKTLKEEKKRFDYSEKINQGIKKKFPISEIENRLKDPHTFKEAFILAEILGKPKALRGKWQRNLF